MPAGIYNFTCEQGTTFLRDIEVTNFDDTIRDLTGYTARMQVRRDMEASSALIELTTENGRMQILSALGTVSLVISATDTAALTQGGIYDLEIMNNDGAVERLLQGNFNLDENVTT
tara:strand:- start:1007 stop:1354 length:348 start_codon:yes stop_codon:yes gene_type:complete